jgi:hypothetical protein
MFEINLSKGDQLSSLVKDLKRAAMKRQFEPTPDGLVLVGGHVNLAIGGIFTSWIQRHEWVQKAIDAGDKEKEAWMRKAVYMLGLAHRRENYFTDMVAADHNLIPNAGLRQILNCIFGSTAKISTWYQGLIVSSAAPAANWTGAWGAVSGGSADELPAASYGGGSGTRQSTAFTNIASGLKIESTAPASFTLHTGATADVYGSTLNESAVPQYTNSPTKILIAATQFSVPKTGLAATDVINVDYEITASST